MNRLTDNSWCCGWFCGVFGACDDDTCEAHMAWERLRQYEDSGLTPEMCKSIKRALEAGCGTATVTVDYNAAHTIGAYMRLLRGCPGVAVATLAPKEDANAAPNI